jgi:hypothetical protein
MKSIHIGVDTNQFDQFLYLPKRFVGEFKDCEYSIHHVSAEQISPRLYNSSFELLNDSKDIYLHPAPSAYNAIVPLPNHIPMQLWEKPTQLSFLTKLKATTTNPALADFYVPQYVCVIPNSGRQQSKRQFAQMQQLGDKFVLRPNQGANGLGVKIISGDLIPKSAEELNSVEWISSVASNQAELDKYSSAGFHFCEYIDATAEVRVVRAADGNMISAKRNLEVTETSNGMPLARVKEQYSVILSETLKDLNISCEQVNVLIESLEPMQKCGSYDIWVNQETGKFGLYEFSTQFALNQCDPDLRMDFMKFYLTALVKDKF